MESQAEFCQGIGRFSELPQEILIAITCCADPEACLSLLQTCHLVHSLAFYRTFWVNLIHTLRLRRPVPVDEAVADINKLRSAVLRALRLHNKWENESDYHPSRWRIIPPLDPSSTVGLNTPFPDIYVWFADEDTIVHVIRGMMICWRDGRTGALITSFRMRQRLLIADTCFINGGLFVAVEVGNNTGENARTSIEIWRSSHPEGPVWEMDLVGQLNLAFYKQHAIFLTQEASTALSARIVSLLDMQQWIVPIHFEVKDGSIRARRDDVNQQFTLRYSVDDKTLIYSLRHETLLTHRPSDETAINIVPRQHLCLSYLHGAMQQETSLWARRICMSWDGERVVIWRPWTTDSGEARLIATVHDISGSDPSDIPVTPTQVCPEEDILMDIPLNILEDDAGNHLHHIGCGAKGIAWMTAESTLMLLEVPPLEDWRMNRKRERIRPLCIPSSVGVEDHGQVMDIHMDDYWGRVVLAMRDETLIIFEFA